MGYMLGGFFVGLVIGIGLMVAGIILYFKKVKPKLEDLALKVQLQRMDKENKK